MDDVSVDLLGSLHDITAATVIANKMLNQLYDNGNIKTYVPLAYKCDFILLPNIIPFL